MDDNEVRQWVSKHGFTDEVTEAFMLLGGHPYHIRHTIGQLQDKASCGIEITDNHVFECAEEWESVSGDFKRYQERVGDILGGGFDPFIQQWSAWFRAVPFPVTLLAPSLTT